MIVNILLLIFTLTVIFIILEISLRIYFHGPERVIAVNPMIREYSKYQGKLNGEGMRGKDYIISKPNNTIRVAVIGDSFVYGAGIKNTNNTFEVVLEDKLNKRNDGLNYEVMNFGKPGTNLDQYFERLENKVIKYNPDIVIIGYMLYDFQISDEKINKITTIDADPWTIPLLGFWIRDFSYSYYFLESELNRIFEAIGIRGFFSNKLQTAYKSEENQKINFEILSRIKKECESNNISTGLIIFPMIYNIENYQLREVHSIIYNVSTNSGIYTYDLLPDFEKYKTEELIANRYDSHPNELGANITAEALYKIIVEKKLT